MTALINPQQVAVHLSGLWALHRKREFLAYLANTLGYEATGLPTFARMYIAQIQNGDAQEGQIGGIVEHWWVMDDHGLRDAEVEELAFDSSGDFYIEPVLKFYLEGGMVALGEAYGPRLRCRKVGLVSVHDGLVKIDNIKVVWSQPGTVKASGATSGV